MQEIHVNVKFAVKQIIIINLPADRPLGPAL
jgi:hypothetical protein